MTNPRIIDCGSEPDAAWAAAEESVKAGSVIVIPTDTVYGVAADPFVPGGVQRLLDAKKRGRDMPPPVLISDPFMVDALIVGLPDDARTIAEAFWPGGLTIIGRSVDALRLDLGDRGATIAVRVPDHGFVRELLRRTGPLAVSSANISGQPAATSASEAADQLGESVALYLDGGPTSDSVPSTIVDFSHDTPAVLREGVISIAQLNEVVPGLIPVPEPEPAADLEPEPEPEPESATESQPQSESEQEAQSLAGGPTASSDPATASQAESTSDGQGDAASGPSGGANDDAAAEFGLPSDATRAGEVER